MSRIFDNLNEVLEYFMSNKRQSHKDNLDKMQCLCGLFNHPEKAFKSIHVTGTNGKGSVVAYLRSVLKEAGLKVGSFTSPYIERFNERINYDGVMISDEEVVTLANEIVDKVPLLEEQGFSAPTFFEFVTLLGFLYFSRINELDLAIIEVGIGGRFDNTNVLDPLIDIITGVSRDHMQILGPTERDILWNKLGIARPHIPFLANLEQPELIEYAKDYAKSENFPLYVTPMSELEILKTDLNGTRFRWRGFEYELQMLGAHQATNAIIAIEALEMLSTFPFINQKSNFHWSHEILLRGLQNTRWIGRLEMINHKPLILVDGAHNDDGIRKACEFIHSLTGPKTKRAIFACSSDKERSKMISMLDGTFDEIIFTSFAYHRHTDVNLLYELSNNPHKKLITDFTEIMDYIHDSPMDLNIFIGSLYLVSEFRPKLLDYKF